MLHSFNLKHTRKIVNWAATLILCMEVVKKIFANKWIKYKYLFVYKQKIINEISIYYILIKTIYYMKT